MAELSTDSFRSGFVSFVGRPNVGKSTLLNQILNSKVTIVSNKAQTTRHQVRGVLTKPDSQIVFIDTPGISKPQTPLGERLNESAESAQADVDINCLVIDGAAGFGKGDRYLAEKFDPAASILIVNKIDGLAPERVVAQLAKVQELGFSSYFPVSAWTGAGVEVLVDYLDSLLPEGPRWFPEGMTSDVDEVQWVAELVREQLFHLMRDEVPHSIATRVAEWEWPRIRVEILVERNSQKGIVIGKRGQVLKDVGTRVRKQLPKGAFLELVVDVADNWQQDRASIERFGY